MSANESGERRAGAQTRAEILRVALALFTEKGYEATSTRDIGEALGIRKSSLYHHFRNKEAIVTSLMTERRADIDELIEWITAQPAGPDLLTRAVDRWVRGTTPDGLRTMKLAQANQPVLRRLVAEGLDVRSSFNRVIDLLAPPEATSGDRLLIRMAFDTASAALLAAQGTDATPDDILAAAREAARALARTAEERPPLGPIPAKPAEERHE